jgi:hypothetical protein
MESNRKEFISGTGDTSVKVAAMRSSVHRLLVEHDENLGRSDEVAVSFVDTSHLPKVWVALDRDRDT